MEEKDTRMFLNQIYEQLFRKALQMKVTLDQRALECECRFYNGHYEKNEDGKWQMDFFPIPVIEMKQLCDIEIGLNKISVSARMARDKALRFDYSQIAHYVFEVYGSDDYLNDFYHHEMKLEEGIKRMEKSDEQEIGFSFAFPFEVCCEDVCDLVMLLKNEAFYN